MQEFIMLQTEDGISIPVEVKDGKIQLTRTQLLQLQGRCEIDCQKEEVLSIIEHYHNALDLLDCYDHQNMERPKGNKATYVLTYEECRSVLHTERFCETSVVRQKFDSESFPVHQIHHILCRNGHDCKYRDVSNHQLLIDTVQFLEFHDRIVSEVRNVSNNHSHTFKE